MTKKGLGDLLVKLTQETRRAYKDGIGAEISEERAKELVRDALQEIWPEYLEARIQKFLQLGDAPKRDEDGFTDEGS